MKLRTTAGGIAVAAAIAASLSVTAPAAQARTTGSVAPGKDGTVLRDDFNGDGYSDAVFSVPDAGLTTGEANHDGGGAPMDGYVAVMYGSSTGVVTSSKQVFDQNKPGIPGDAQQLDGYGSSVTSADLDRDGYADLVVGAGGDSDNGDSGSLSVIWGGPAGLSGSTWLSGSSGPDDRVGEDVVVGDFDGDGVTDVATSIHGWDLRVLTGPFDRTGTPAGGVHEVPGVESTDVYGMSDLAAGDVNGDGVTDVVSAGGRYDTGHINYFKGTAAGLSPGFSIAGLDGAGDNLDVGDVNGDHRADIVIGRPDGSNNGGTPLPAAKGGMVTYVPGSANGPNPAALKRINQDSPGVPGVAEEDTHGSDGFGAGVSVGDIDGDGYADVSVGVPGEAFDDVMYAGSTVTLRGTAAGLTGTGAKVFSENTAGIPGVAREGDAFGTATKLTDVNGDGRADLLVGARGEGDMGDEDTTDGSVWVLKSTATGITPTGSITFGCRTLGVPLQNGGGLGSVFAS